MVHVRELRLGNILYDPDKQTYVMVKVLLVTSEHYRLQPVPITKELLINSGFAENREYCYGKKIIDSRSPGGFKDVIVELWHEEESNIWLLSIETMGVFCSKHVKYLHELQNVFAVLTGLELEVDGAVILYPSEGGGITKKDMEDAEPYAREYGKS